MCGGNIKILWGGNKERKVEVQPWISSVHKEAQKYSYKRDEMNKDMDQAGPPQNSDEP